MAEIKIQKKSPVWPWILLIIAVVAGIAYYMYTKNELPILNKDDENARLDSISKAHEEKYPSTTASMDSNNAVAEFSNSIIDSTRIGMDSTYTKTAIKNLAKVVTMKAEQANLQTSNALENLKNYTNHNMDSMNHSDMNIDWDNYKNFKTVSNDIVTVLESIQAKNYPSLENELSDLKQSFNKIDSNVTTKQQQQITLQTFFTKAKNVVNNMNS